MSAVEELTSIEWKATGAVEIDEGSDDGEGGRKAGLDGKGVSVKANRDVGEGGGGAEGEGE